MERRKKNFWAVLLALIFALLLSGCVTTGHQFTRPEPPPSGQSIIYFYRANELLTNSTSPGIMHNGNKVMPLMVSGGYWKYYINPGTHLFSPQQFGLYKKETLTLTNDRPGQTYYVEMVLNVGYIGMKLRSESEGLAGIAECHELKGKTDGRQVAGSPAATDPSAVGIQPPPGRSTIHVTSFPQNARVRIMNIKPKFQQDMVLSPGKYHLEVSAAGYQKKIQWVTLKKDQAAMFDVSLQPK